MMIDSLILYDDDLHKSLLGLSYSFQSMSGVRTKRIQPSGTTLHQSMEGTANRVVGAVVKEKVMIFLSFILITIQIRIFTLTAVLDPQKTDMQKE